MQTESNFEIILYTTILFSVVLKAIQVLFNSEVFMSLLHDLLFRYPLNIVWGFVFSFLG